MRNLAAVVIILLSACGSEPASAPPLPTWSTASEPSLVIGGAEGTGPTELDQVTSSVRLDDGTILLANSGTHELRWFDSAGHFLKTMGRQGKGPGEYTGRLFLAGNEDTLKVLDSGNRRLTLIDRSNDGIRTAPLLPGNATEFPGNVLVYRQTWATLPPATVSAETVRTALDALDDDIPAGRVREARWTSSGSLWTRNPGDSAWTVHVDGHPIASARLPAGFEVQDFGPDWVLGLERDRDDVERIALYALQGTPTPAAPDRTVAPPPYNPVAEAAAHPELVESIAADLRSILMAQEMYFSNHGAYASTADSLALSPTSGATLGIYLHSGFSWVAVATHPDLRLTCAMGVGALTPPGWEEGEVKCG